MLFRAEVTWRPRCRGRRDPFGVEDVGKSDGKDRPRHLVGGPERVLEGVDDVGVVDGHVAGEEVPAEGARRAHEDEVLLRRERQLSRHDL